MPYSYSADTIQLSGSEFTPVQQTITVKTTPTGSASLGNYVASKPVKNALVRLDGVPRYTDSSGQIRAELTREYVELFVEKDGYNPYIEIIEATGNEKIVYLKQPNDDIEIYAAMLLYSGEYNILTQPCHVNESIDDSYYSEIKIHCNVEADDYFLLVNGVRRFYSDEPTFFNMKFNTLKPDDKISVQVIYQGIESKIIDTFLYIDELKEEDHKEPEGGEVTPPIDDGSSGIFTEMKFDFVKLLNLDKLLSTGKGSNSKVLLQANYNRREGTLKIQAGYSYENWLKKDDDKLSDLQRYRIAEGVIDSCNQDIREINAEREKLQSELSDNDARLRELMSRNREDRDELEKLQQQQQNIKNKIKEVKDDGGNSKYLRTQANNKQEAIDNISRSIKDRDKEVSKCVDKINNGEMSIKDALKKLENLADIKDITKEAYTQHDRGMTLGFEIFGVIEFNVKGVKSIREWKVKNIALSVAGSIGYKWHGTFMVWVIPCFYTVSVKLELKVDLRFFDEEAGAPTWLSWEDVKQCMLVKLSLELRGEVGVGIDGILAVSFYAKLNGELSVYPAAEDEEGKPYYQDWDNYGWEVKISIGVRVQALFWDWDFGHEWVLTERDPKKPLLMLGQESIAELQSIAALSARSVPLVLSATDFNLALSENQIFDSIYQGSVPKLVQINGQTMILWVEDNIDRDDYNRTILKYSLLDNGVWSAPKAVYDNGKADFYFDVCVDNGKLCVVWQKANQLFTSKDSFIEVGAASEIYYSEFIIAEKKFGNIIRITNDETIDYAPKFAIKEKSTDPLTVVWQKNSDNNIMAFSGTNEIWYASKIDGKFVPEKLCEVNNYISFLTSAIIGGNLVTSFTYDIDGNFVTDDKAIVVISGSEIKILSEPEEIINNPQFSLIGGVVTLFYHSNGNVVFTQDFENIMKLSGIDEGIINSAYQVVETNENLTFFYTKIGGNGVLQAYCAIFDYSAKEWIIDIKLTNENFDICNLNAFINNNGNIISVYNIKDENGITVMAYSEKRLATDFEIISINFDETLKNGERATFILGIQNTGDQNLYAFTIEAFNQSLNIVLDEPIFVGEYGFAVVEFVFDQSVLYTEFIVTANEISKSFFINTMYTDVQLSCFIEVINQKQIFNLFIDNYSIFDTECVLQIYMNGQSISKQDIFMCRESQLVMTFEFENLSVGDIISFEILTDLQNRFASNNSIKLLSLINTTSNTNVLNQYYDVLQKVKGLLI